MTDPRRQVPRTDTVLRDPALEAATDRLGPAAIKTAVHAQQQRIRDGALAPDDLVEAVLQTLPTAISSLRTVLNATGTILHTNLGRAALSPAAVEAMGRAAGNVDVEYDLSTGQRAGRGRGALAALRRALPDAGDVMIANNGAAALLLAVTALSGSERRDVIWSRGELIEIGDGFRLPDLVASTGARIHEVGTTNRTALADYAAAIGPHTACALKVHPSNFTVTGFTASVPIDQLATLGVPVVVDVGSGLLHPDPLLPHEPDVTSSLRAGADLVTASGDKLLGGPQAGVIAGRADLIAALRRHPLARALRVDKITLAALEATLEGPPTPTWEALHADPKVLRDRALRVAAALDALVVPSAGVVGGGGAPGVELEGWAVSLPQELAEPLRQGEPPVVGRVTAGRLLLDLRTVPPPSDDALIAAVRAVRA